MHNIILCVIIDNTLCPTTTHQENWHIGKSHIQNRVIAVIVGSALFTACAYAAAVIVASLGATVTNAMMQSLLREATISDIASSSLLQRMDPDFQPQTVLHRTQPIWELVTSPGSDSWAFGLIVASALIVLAYGLMMDAPVAAWVRAHQTA